MLLAGSRKAETSSSDIADLAASLFSRMRACVCADARAHTLASAKAARRLTNASRCRHEKVAVHSQDHQAVHIFHFLVIFRFLRNSSGFKSAVTFGLVRAFPPAI